MTKFLFVPRPFTCLEMGPLLRREVGLVFLRRRHMYCTVIQHKSESELLYDWRFTANQSWRQAPWDSRPVIFFLQLNSCCHSPYVTSSLTRGWVCSLHLLLVLASGVILRFDSHGTHDHILLSQIRDSPNLKSQVPVFIYPWNRVAQL
jgi:hypothetical protein